MDIQALQRIAISVTCEHSLECVLQTITDGLATEPDMALARIWLIAPGDICESCPMESECQDRSACLHLVSSRGESLDGRIVWDRVDGDYRRFPIGSRKVGQVAAQKKAALLSDISADSRWLRDPHWAEQEHITSFAAQPLMFRGECLGVLGVFSRTRLDGDALTVLKAFADHAGAAIANARAFEEIERLRKQLELENEYLREEVHRTSDYGGIVGQSSALKKLLEQIDLVAKTDSSVLLLGESGTGKELVARAIHEAGARSSRPMVKVNCASIPRELFESEFFGHVKGAFTGALKNRAGRFELAHGGTLFLDEISEIPLELQGKLLRVLQEGQFERIGDEITQEVDVRVIAATNRNLKEDVAENRFRQDLYYRLSVFPIDIPPLRERIEDVPTLAAHFVEQLSKKINVPPSKLRKGDVLRLQQYPWPGNVRELQNVIERALITSQGGRLQFDLPSTARTENQTRPAPSNYNDEESDVMTVEEMKYLEKENLIRALNQTNWKISGKGSAALLLHMKPTTLASRIKTLDIKRI